MSANNAIQDTIQARETIEAFVSKLKRMGEQTSKADISVFAAEIGVPLPDGYRMFLALNNGGRFDGNAEYSLPIPDRCFESLSIIEQTAFFGLNIGKQYYDLRSNVTAYEGRIPNDTIAIAEHGDEMLLLDVRSKKPRGSIFVVRDYELLRDRNENRIFVASSIDTLIAGCQEVAEED